MEDLGKVSVGEKKHKEVVLFPLPLQGHINPMLQLASILHSQGFSISIIHTEFNSPKTSQYPEFIFHSIPDGVTEKEEPLTDLVTFMLKLNAKCIIPFQNCLEKMLSSGGGRKGRIACLITDAVWYCTQAVADKLKIRRMILRTTSISSLPAFFSLSGLRQRGFLPIQDSQLEEVVPGLQPLKGKDLPILRSHDPEDYYQLLDNITKETRASSGIIANTFEELEEKRLKECQKDLHIPIFTIGPFHKHFPASSSSLLEQDRSSITWLDKQEPRSVLYISFGSLATIDRYEFMEIAWGLAKTKQPFLWVVRKGLIRGSFKWLELLRDELLEVLKSTGYIVNWAPQQEVLAHPSVGGFWTHTGWNSTLESICEGVPIICLPVFGDQKVNAIYVAHVWRVGLHLEGKLDRKQIEFAIRTLMAAGPGGDEIRERMNKLKEKVDLCLKPGGSSYMSLRSLVEYLSF